MGDRVIYKTENFQVDVPNLVHITRKEGGHLCIRPIEPIINRTYLSPKKATELIRLTMLVGEAYEKAMKIRGVEIGIINYQENGNWAFLKNVEPKMHIHVYGRTNNSNKQHWGEALFLPNPSTDFYNDNEPINEGDIEEILNQIKLLENEEKYKLENWSL